MPNRRRSEALSGSPPRYARGVTTLIASPAVRIRKRCPKGTPGGTIHHHPAVKSTLITSEGRRSHEKLQPTCRTWASVSSNPTCVRILMRRKSPRQKAASLPQDLFTARSAPSVPTTTRRRRAVMASGGTETRGHVGGGAVSGRRQLACPAASRSAVPPPAPTKTPPSLLPP